MYIFMDSKVVLGSSLSRLNPLLFNQRCPRQISLSLQLAYISDINFNTYLSIIFLCLSSCVYRTEVLTL
jgi:hypothetical protein